MPIIFRTDGAWGIGKGVNLTPAEVDGNFYDIDGRVTYIEDNPVEPVTPIAINIEGGLFTMGLSNGDVLGPITITYPMPLWRGAWMPSVNYNEMDFFTAPDGGLGAVMIGHTSAATFNWAALDPGSGRPLYQQLVGGSGTTSGIFDLVDVAPIGPSLDGDLLVYNFAASLWVNRSSLDVTRNVLPAFAGDSGSGGFRGLVPAPAAGDAAAGKVLGAGGVWIVPPSGSGGGSSSLAGLIDVSIVSPADLSLLQYSVSDGKWHNRTLLGLGAGTVTQVNSGAGLSGGPINSTGTLSLAPIGTLNLLANVTGGPATPAGVTLSILLDAVLGTVRGSLLRRDVTGWTVLLPGTAGQYLKTGGAGADPAWDNPAGTGTVTQVNSGAGLAGGPITATGTLSLAPIADGSVLGNVSGSAAAPAATTLTLLLDHVLGSTRGMLLYRGATGWAALSPGTAGQVLTTGGAGADPAWAPAAGGGASITIGDTPPASPTAGALWWDSVGGQLYLWYNDGSSSQWVPSANQPGPTGATGPAGSANMSGMTAGQIPIAATATSVTSSGNLSGAVTTSGSLVTTLAANAVATANIANANVTYAKIQNVTNNRVLGNTSGSAAAPSEIVLPLAVANGGTGSATAGAALTALGAFPAAGGTTTGPVTVTGTMAATAAQVNNGQFYYALSSTATQVQLMAVNGTNDLIVANNVTGGIFCGSGTGWVFGGATGGVKGAGTLNAPAVYAAGALLTSDARLKRDIDALPDCLPLVARIEPKAFRWLPPADPEQMPPQWAERRHWGMMAQDVAAAMREAGHDFGGHEVGPDGTESIGVGDMMAVLWQAVRELTDKVAVLEGRR